MLQHGVRDGEARRVSAARVSCRESLRGAAPAFPPYPRCRTAQSTSTQQEFFEVLSDSRNTTVLEGIVIPLAGIGTHPYTVAFTLDGDTRELPQPITRSTHGTEYDDRHPRRHVRRRADHRRHPRRIVASDLPGHHACAIPRRSVGRTAHRRVARCA
ncbi:hypothetical protein [Burkholderia sp. SIMBA_062]|uniref:hypothetical protein n=1 Tax=Burkholderia sp. SIMBA_062 TaxID=3085803 RepID=UPI00397D3106